MPFVRFVVRPHRTALLAGEQRPQKVFLMLKFLLRRDLADHRPPVAFVFVIDTSDSMRRQNRIEGAIRALEEFLNYSELAPDDRVAIVKFDDRAEVLLPMTPLSERGEILAVMDALRSLGGGTEIGEGLRKAYSELLPLPGNVLRKVFLLTDGYTYEEEEALKAAEALSELRVPVVALGLGTEYHEEFLMEIADRTHGRVYHLDDAFLLPAIFYQEVGLVVREAVTDVQMDLKLEPRVTLDAITKVYPNIQPIPVARRPYPLGNLITGDFTVFVLELTLNPPFEGERYPLGNLRFSYYVPAFDEHEEIGGQPLTLPVTHDPEIAREVDDEVLGYVEQRNIENLIRRALTEAKTDPVRAQQTLQMIKSITQRMGNPNVTAILDRAIQELAATQRLSPSVTKTLVVGTRTQTRRVATKVVDPELLEELEDLEEEE